MTDHPTPPGAPTPGDSDEPPSLGRWQPDPERWRRADATDRAAWSEIAAAKDVAAAREALHGIFRYPVVPAGPAYPLPPAPPPPVPLPVESLPPFVQATLARVAAVRRGEYPGGAKAAREAELAEQAYRRCLALPPPDPGDAVDRRVGSHHDRQRARAGRSSTSAADGPSGTVQPLTDAEVAEMIAHWE